MNRYDIARVVGGLIVVLIGFAIAVGSFQLRGGKPLSWPDIVAEDATVRIAAGAMAAVAAVLVVAGAAAMLALGWGLRRGNDCDLRLCRWWILGELCFVR